MARTKALKIVPPPDTSPVTPEEVAEIQAQAAENLFEDLDSEMPVLRADGIPALDSDLAPDEKKMFVSLLNRFMRPLGHENDVLGLLKAVWVFAEIKARP